MRGVERKGIIDQVAAVLILQAFLEARGNAKARAEVRLSRPERGSWPQDV